MKFSWKNLLWEPTLVSSIVLQTITMFRRCVHFFFSCILIKIMGTLQTASNVSHHFLSRVSNLVFGIKYFNQKLICALVLFSLFGIIKVFLRNGRPFYYCIGIYIWKLQYLPHFCIDSAQIFRSFATL